jgi:hypothetical protein
MSKMSKQTDARYAPESVPINVPQEFRYWDLLVGNKHLVGNLFVCDFCVSETSFGGYTYSSEPLRKHRCCKYCFDSFVLPTRFDEVMGRLCKTEKILAAILEKDKTKYEDILKKYNIKEKPSE